MRKFGALMLMSVLAMGLVGCSQPTPAPKPAPKTDAPADAPKADAPKEEPKKDAPK